MLNECMFTENQQNFISKTFNSVAIYSDTTTEEQAIARIQDRNIVIMDQFLLTLTEYVFQKCPNIELIILNTTAYDNIDLLLLKKYNVKLAHLRDYATQDVSETGIAMVMALNNNIQIAQKITSPEFFVLKEYKHENEVVDIWPGHSIIPLIKRKQLKHQTIGIVGMGHIGQRSAELSLALGMKVIAFNRTKKYIRGVELVPLRRLFTEADIIYIALSYDKSTMKNFISKEYLALAKQDSILVSVAHPDLLDMQYVIHYHEKFKGIGFDYLVTEEVKTLSKKREYNIIITPHLGSQSVDAFSNMTDSIIEAAVSFSNGRPLYLVN